MTRDPSRLPLALGLVAAVAVAVAAALWVVGGPGTARLERYDERRVRDATELVNAIERHRIFAGRLPDSLEMLREGLSGSPPIHDPQTGEPYEYEAMGGGRFRLCIRLSAPGAPPATPGPIRMGESRRMAIVEADLDGGRLCWQSAEPPG